MAIKAIPRPAPRTAPLPRTWSIGAAEIVAVLVANGVLILGLWLRHGGLEQLSTLGGQLTAIGQLTARVLLYVRRSPSSSSSAWVNRSGGRRATGCGSPMSSRRRRMSSRST